MDVNKLKSKVVQLAKAIGVPHQNIYDMYFFERFLCRLSQSAYYDNFVLKGGFLLENIVGVKARTTMDIDLKAVGIVLSDEKVKEIFSEIASVKNDDEVEYSVLSVSDITADMKYGGKSVKIEARLKNLKRTFTVDIALGDLVTPYPEKRIIRSLLDDSKFNILAYNSETVIAEKFETLISKGMSNSRAKDLFDIHVLMQRNVDIDRLNAALINTFYVRQTEFNINTIRSALDGISQSDYRREVFDQYVKKTLVCPRRFV